MEGDQSTSRQLTYQQFEDLYLKNDFQDDQDTVDEDFEEGFDRLASIQQQNMGLTEEEQIKYGTAEDFTNEVILGDIVISLETANKQAMEKGYESFIYINLIFMT